ncbi:hydantoinase/oxoprolinase family protein [Paracoccus suum]|uniref:Hydantoinase/oxoprolinase family protein n=1 Tax=Paracoccus suum TaxID=2259340 RepID=A0A344PMZ7_9RHOB|nr:hydantoinase/oxoprolinase family protein [Paracoccus suum]AXC50752.1 hydantoinase/oxoprolinase family protein [Paracoccus suum]
MAELRVAIDIGGTFTDVCIMDAADNSIRVTKVPTTPDPIDGFMAGLARGNVDLRDVALLSHGTTIATNALITRRLPRTALVTTQGFRDVIEIRRSDKEDLWDTYKDVAPPYIPRRDRLDVPERVDGSGKIVTPLDEARAREIARILKKRDVKAVAVCFINAYLNPANERRMKEILVEELDDVPVATSSETLPEIFEHERFSTTVVNAALSPVAGDYCAKLDGRLRDEGYSRELLLLHSGGGSMTANAARHYAARLAGSGIAAGAIAGRHIAVQCGFPNSISLDMGGTSCDVSLAVDGKSTVTKDWFIEFGYPIRFPAIELRTIGAGGGSHAWIDPAGSLRNGPQSAGSNPGPACYGNGNTIPTNTDANLVLGRQGTSLAGGRLTLDPALAETAVREGIAEPLGMELHEAAEAIVQVANANMADAVRLLSITRGHDPRDFALVAFGGAGALHGVEIARELAVPVVIVPPNPGVTSAMGCLLVDIQHDLSQTLISPLRETDPAIVAELFAKLEADAWALLKDEGVAPENVVLERSIDMMYRGQWRSLTVPVGASLPPMSELEASFHALHEQEYNFRRDEAVVSIHRVNLTAIGVVPKASVIEHEPVANTPEPIARRPVWFKGKAHNDTPVYQREALNAGALIVGPAIIEQFDSTTVVPPATTAEIDRFRNIVIRFEGQA